MFRIDQYAYSNRLRFFHPAEKFAFAIITMIICLAFTSMATSLAISILMAGGVTLYAGIPWRFYLKLLSLPVSFLVIGVATVAVSISRNPGDILYGIKILGYTVGATPESLKCALNLFLKSLGSVSCLYFLSLTTPMIEIILVLKKLKVPTLFIELMTLIYRFIFVLIETADKIYTSQSSRCGYASLRTSYLSLGQLTSNLFLKAYQQSQMLFTTLLSRCYTGELKVVEPQYTLSKKNIFVVIAIDLLLVALALYKGGGFFGRDYP